MDIINVYRSKEHSCSISLASGLFALFLSLSSTSASNGYKLSIVNYENEIDFEFTVIGQNFDSWRFQNSLSDIGFNNQAVDTAHWDLVSGKGILKYLIDELIDQHGEYQINEQANCNITLREMRVWELSNTFKPSDEAVTIIWRNGVGKYRYMGGLPTSLRWVEESWESPANSCASTHVLTHNRNFYGR